MSLDMKIFNKLSLRLGAKSVLLITVALWTGGSAAFAQRAVEQRRFDAEERTNINVFRQSSPSVVNICTKQALSARSGDMVLDIGQIPKGSGTGFIWDSSGHIVTNHHVIDGADIVSVTLADGTELEAAVVRAAPEFDVAVLKVSAAANRLRPLAIGRSNNLEVGQKVFAIGNPFGLDQTLTSGIVSALDRQIESSSGVPIRGMIQTDAAINPGNSGGPLIDNEGRLIGMNTAIISRSGGSAGVGFAVPVDTIRATVPRLIAGRGIESGFLGIALASRQISSQASDLGVAIVEVTQGSPADQSGIRSAEFAEGGGVAWGDILISVDGNQVSEAGEASTQLLARAPGDEVVLGIKRGEDFLRVPVRLSNPSGVNASAGAGGSASRR